MRGARHAADLLGFLAAADLFGKQFPSPSWDAWRVFAKVLSGLPLAEAEAPLFTACTGRWTWPTSRATEAWVI